MDLLTFIREHFGHVAPILVVGALSLGIVIERSFTLFVRYPIGNFDRFFDKLSNLVMSARIADASKFCDGYGSKPVAQIAKSAIERAHLPENLIQDGVQLAIQDCTAAIMKHTAFLATAANVATLLGLFGTIAGLIQSFEAVAHADPQQKAALLSAGIATAMNATMLGLAVAIPSMVAFSFLASRSNKLITQCEKSAIRVGDILKQRFYAEETSGSSREEGHSRSAA